MPHIPSLVLDVPGGDAYGFDAALVDVPATWLDWAWLILLGIGLMATAGSSVSFLRGWATSAVVLGVLAPLAIVGAGVTGCVNLGVRADGARAAAEVQREAFADWAADVYGIEVDKHQARALLAGRPTAVTYLGYRNAVTAVPGDSGLLYLFGANGIELAAAVGWVPGDTIDPDNQPPNDEQPDTADEDITADQDTSDQG